MGVAAAILAVVSSVASFAAGMAAIAVACALVLAFVRPVWAIYLAVALIPLDVLSIDVSAIALSALAVLGIEIEGGLGVTPSEFVSVIAAGGWFAQRMVRRDALLPKSPLTLPLLALVAATIPGLFFAEDTFGVMKQLVMWSAFYIAFLALVSERDEKAVLRLATVLALTGGAVSAIAIAKSAGAQQQLFEFGAVVSGRATGSFSHPALLGLFIIMTATLQLALLVRGRGVIRPVAGICFLLSMIAVVLSLTRGAFLALAVAFGLLLVFWPPMRRLALVAVPAVLLLAVVNFNPAGGVVNTDVLLERISSIPSGAGDPSRLRLQLYQETPQMIEDHPVFGVGAKNFPQAAPDYGLLAPGLGQPIGHAHNLVLGVTSEMGLVGLLAFLWLVVALIGVLRQTRRRRLEPYGAIGVAAMAAFAAIAVDGLFSYAYSNNAVTLTLFALSALAAMVARLPVAEPQRAASGQRVHARARGRIREPVLVGGSPRGGM